MFDDSCLIPALVEGLAALAEDVGEEEVDAGGADESGLIPAALFPDMTIESNGMFGLLN